MSQVSPEYIAGLFDGEGYVGIRRRHDRKNPSYRYQVEIANTNREVLEQIQSQYGGKLRTKWNREDMRCWYTLDFYCARDVRNILEVIKDFVRVKKDQVDLAIQCIDGSYEPQQGEWRLKAMKRVDHVLNLEVMGHNYLEVVAEQWDRKGKKTWLQELDTIYPTQAA